jgi:outer membrane protein assembly factor BamB
MKITATIVGVAVALFAMAAASRSHFRYVPLIGPPAPIKKWAFATMPSIVQDCVKPGNPGYGFVGHKCDPRTPDTLPEHSPAIDADGTIYVGGANRLYALNPDGTEKWFYETEAQVKYSPILYAFVADDSKIWFDFQSSYGTAGFYRVDASGQGKAIVSGVHAVTQAGLLKDGTIFVLWDQTGPAFLTEEGFQEPASGSIPNGMIRQNWWDAEFGIPEKCRPPAFGSEDSRYLGCKDELIVLQPDGKTRWSYPIPGQVSQPAVAEDGTVYVGSEDSNVYALSADGKLKWKVSTGGAVFSTPAIAKNGTIFFGSNDGCLYAVGPDGKLKWEFKTSGQVFSPTIGSDGTVYAQSADGNLYAIQDLEQNGGLWGQWAKWAGGVRNTWRGPAPN